MFVELVLTCETREEAEKIADALLQKKLIACVKFLPVESKFWWEGKIQTGKETLMLMESRADNFDKVEAEVSKLHSYETFVLQALPIAQISKDAASWLEAETVGEAIDKARGQS